MNNPGTHPTAVKPSGDPKPFVQHTPPNGVVKSNGEFRQVWIPTDDILPSPENDQVYRPIDTNDPEIITLAKSIQAHGIQEPLLVTQDHFIISGHRRHAAATLAGLTSVPCIVDHIYHNDPQFLKLLRECNRQRVKTHDEQLREEIIATDQEDAYQALVQYRKKASRVECNEIEIVGEKRRAEISKAKIPFLKAVIQIINDLREYWPLSERQIHYQLLNSPPLRHASKPDSAYRNDRASNQDLSDLVTRARLNGKIPWEAIHDPTRPVQLWRTYANTGPFIRRELDTLFKGYWRNLQQSQPNHIEIMVEKNTLTGIIDNIAAEFCIPFTSGRGFCSAPPRREMAERFHQSGKEKLVVLMLTDFDPEGEEIAHSFARSMRDDFSIDDIVPVKVALNADQVKALNLPPQMQAKETSVNYDKFTQKHGKTVFELEAVPPAELQKILRTAIESVLNLDLFNKELEAEKQDAGYLSAVRNKMLEYAQQINFGGLNRS